MSNYKGIVNVIKPPGMTSFEVVKWLKKKLDINKAGHTGTLDPTAAGVLPVCLGKATKLIQYLPEETKEYIGELTLGITTNTLDTEGKIINKSEKWKQLTTKQLEKDFQKFTGRIDQIPPMFSAVHHKGKRLYELARKGKKVKRKARKVEINKLDILDVNLPLVRFRVQCSKGTYIRSLVRDIGEKLETGAFLSFLLRTSSGPFNINMGFTIQEIEEQSQKNNPAFIIPPEQPLNYLHRLIIKDEVYKKSINGAILKKNEFINWPENLKNGELVTIHDRNGAFISINKVIIETNRIRCKPKRVLI